VPLVAESDPDSHLKLLGSFVVDLDLTACECGLGALKNASVVTVPGKPQIVNNGGPADVQSLVAASASSRRARHRRRTPCRLASSWHAGCAASERLGREEATTKAIAKPPLSELQIVNRTAATATAKTGAAAGSRPVRHHALRFRTWSSRPAGTHATDTRRRPPCGGPGVHGQSTQPNCSHWSTGADETGAVDAAQAYAEDTTEPVIVTIARAMPAAASRLLTLRAVVPSVSMPAMLQKFIVISLLRTTTPPAGTWIHVALP
jgi:hypothetical protein